MNIGFFWIILACDVLILLTVLLAAGKRLFCTGREDGMFIRGVKMGFLGVVSLEILGFVNMLILF